MKISGVGDLFGAGRTSNEFDDGLTASVSLFSSSTDYRMTLTDALFTQQTLYLSYWHSGLSDNERIYTEIRRNGAPDGFRIPFKQPEYPTLKQKPIKKRYTDNRY